MSNLMDLAYVACNIQQTQMNTNTTNNNCFKFEDQFQLYSQQLKLQEQQQLLQLQQLQNYRQLHQLHQLRQLQKLQQLQQLKQLLSIKCSSKETVDLDEEKKNKRKRENKAEKVYRCCCPTPYQRVWMLNKRTCVKLCTECKKGMFTVQCTQENKCINCKKFGLNNAPCEISLKFRRQNLDNFNSLVDEMNIFSVHIFQNILKRFNVTASSYSIKRRKLPNGSYSMQTQDEIVGTRARENMHSVINDNQSLLPFTWDDITNVKLLARGSLKMSQV